MNAVEREILGIAKVTTSKGETRQAFLERVVRVVNQQPDEVFNKLTKKARDWTNDASDAVSEGKSIDDFDGGTADDGDEGHGNRDDGAAGGDDDAPDEGGEMDTQTDTGGKGGKRRATGRKTNGAAPKAAAKKAAAKAAPKAAVKAAAKTAAPKEKAERKPRKGSDELTESVPTEIKRALIKNDQLSTVDLMALCQKAGYEAKDSTVRTIASDFRHSLKVLRKAGKL